MSDCSVPDTYDDGTDTYDTDTYDSSSYSTDSVDDQGYTDGYDAEMSTMQMDLDGDGIAETTGIDFDGDGVADAFDVIDPETGAEMVTFDSDGDGLVDTIVTDADGDGTIDAASMDTDGDGQLDTELDPETGEPVGPFTQFDDGTTDTTDTLDTDSTDGTDDGSDDTVHGDPMAEIPYHQAQAGSNDCLPTSVAMVLSEATGTEVDASEVVDFANELGVLGETGMSIEDGLQLLDHWGVEAEVQTGSLDELRDLLDADTPVIIGLDSDDLYGQGDAPFADDFVAGHAVVITGIDDEAGLVYINDPGFPDGAGIAISIDQFEDAWQDADHTMIVAEGTGVDSDAGDDTDLTSAGSAGNVSESVDDVPGLHGTGTEGDDGGLGDAIAKLVLLPFNLVIR